MKRSWYPLALVALLGVCATYDTNACSCDIPDVAAAVAKADAVFLGKVISISPVAKSADSLGPYEVATLKVLRSWKDTLRPDDTVTVRSESGACGMSLSNDLVWLEEVNPESNQVSPAAPPDQWLIYAHGDQPYWLRGCTRTRPVFGDDDPEIESLNKAARADDQNGA